MAPTPRSTSPVKGKSRVYLCRPCNVRHAAPTGNKCPIAKAVRGIQGSNRSLGLKRSVARPSPVASTSAARPRGRPRKTPAPAPLTPVHEPMLFQDTPTSPCNIPLPDDDEDMESADDFLPLTQVPVRQHPFTPPYAVIDPKRPITAIRRPTHRSHAVSPSSSLSSMPSFGQEPSAPTNQPDAATQLILQQLASMQEMTKQEFARIEAENKAERLRLQAENQANVDSLRAQFNSMLDSPRWQAPQPEPQPSTSVNTRHQLSPPTAPRTVSFARHTEVANPPAPANTRAQSPTQAPAAGLSLDGQPPEVTVRPEQIALEESPIKSLRRDQQTSNVAELMLSEVGLAKMIEIDKSSNKNGISSKLHKLRKREAKWPNHYMIRFEDNDPQYDTLNETEFVSGYLSIIEEVTPITPENQKLLTHIEHLRQLMDDCATMDCPSVRAAHRQVLMKIELKMLKWEDTQVVKETKALAMSRLRNRPESLPSFKPTAHQSSSPVLAQPCTAYQKLTCGFATDHVTEGIDRLHCCAYCYRRQGAQHPHPKSECRKCNRGQQRSKKGKQASGDKA